MYLLFSNINRDYGGFDNFVPILIGSSWMGLAVVDEEEGKSLTELAGVEKLTEERFLDLKKKASGEAIAYRSFTVHQQKPEENPNAEYAEKPKAQPPLTEEVDDPKELLNVSDAEVENPLEEEPKPKAKSKPKAKK